MGGVETSCGLRVTSKGAEGKTEARSFDLRITICK